MKTADISEIIKPYSAHVAKPDEDVLHLLTDSRRLVETRGTVFFAIVTKRNSGAKYIEELYNKGVRSFVVPKDCTLEYPDANIWRVDDVVRALQLIVASHRAQYNIPVLGITGSNGKTIVKDWLVQLLSPEGHVASSPKSYNSQIGVPLSVWQMSDADKIGVFEAGISEAGEMSHLQRMIMPTVGIFTNIGYAHDENFLTRGQKIAEKLQLFTHCEALIYCIDHKEIHTAVSTIESFRNIRLFTWGHGDESDVRLLQVHVEHGHSVMEVEYNGSRFSVDIPFVDRASQENAMQCVAFMLYYGYSEETIVKRCAKLTPVEMRLEMDEATGNSLLINDSYSLDLNSLSIALDYIGHINQYHNKVLIISDFMQTGLPEGELYSQVAAIVKQRGIKQVICIGEALVRNKAFFDGMDASFYTSTQDFIDNYRTDQLQNSTILLKGARVFGFERIAKLLQKKNHETVMEVNIGALIHNLNYYRAKLKPTTKLMAMVKASSYGAGRVEVATALQFSGVDYLTVAYADEGVDLRRGGISLPIMVMNPEEASFDDIIRYRLEPDIYSFRILDLFAERLKLLSHGSQYPVHVEFDTGMHRLGFSGDDVDALLRKLEEHSDVLHVQSVFTHLACADDPAMDDFTLNQISRFKEWSKPLPGIKHILNSSGITRFTEAQLDMVRLGIGLYGISPEPDVQKELKQVSRLVTRISQIKDIPEGDTVGYNCRWRAERPSRIAIITIGYADGLHRRLGYGKGCVLINGHEAPIIGSVCMDMCFIDVTGIECNEGDRVVIFGDGDLLQRNAKAAGTIPYELLTAVSPRVKRIYYHEE